MTGTSDRAVVDEVKARLDLVELVGHYVPLRRAGANHLARCPFHDEKTPSFNVSAEKGMYFCFGCKAHGDALRFYQEVEGVTFPEALRALAERVGLELPETRDPARVAEERRQRDLTERLHAVCEAAAQYFERCLQEAEFSELARGALEERGVTAETTAAFRLGYAPAQWDGLTGHLRKLDLSPADGELAGLLLPSRTGGWYDRFRHRLMFPVLDRGGRVVAFSGRVLPESEAIPEGIVPEDAGKYVNSPETPLYRKSELLYGLSNAKMAMRQRAEAVLVEGNFDVVQMHQHGFPETVAPLGTSFTEAQARLLRRFAETVVLVFDGDEAGRKAARAAHPVCARVGLMTGVVTLPERLDPDSFLRSALPGHGPRELAERVKHPQGMVEWLIRDTASTCGDMTPERVAAVRGLAPIISAVRDGIERDVYVREAAKALYLDEAQVRTALREHQQSATRAQDPFTRDDAGRRPGLAVPAANPEDPSEGDQRRAKANALEAVLLCQELLATPAAEALEGLLGERFGPVVALARRQWLERQRLDGEALLALAPDERARTWMAARLVPPGELPKDLPERQAVALGDAVAMLRRARAMQEARALKLQAARSGLQGNPAAEVGTLNEQLRLKRELARPKRGGP